MTKLNEELKNTNDTLSKQTEEIKETNKKLEEKEEELQTIRQKGIQQLSDEIENLKALLEASQKEKGELSTENENYKNEIEELKAMDASKTIEELKEQVNSKNAEAQSLTKELGRSESKVQRLEMQIKQKEDIINSQVQLIGILKSQAEAMNSPDKPQVLDEIETKTNHIFELLSTKLEDKALMISVVEDENGAPVISGNDVTVSQLSGESISERNQRFVSALQNIANQRIRDLHEDNTNLKKMLELDQIVMEPIGSIVDNVELEEKEGETPLDTEKRRTNEVEKEALKRISMLQKRVKSLTKKLENSVPIEEDSPIKLNEQTQGITSTDLILQPGETEEDRLRRVLALNEAKSQAEITRLQNKLRAFGVIDENMLVDEFDCREITVEEIPDETEEQKQERYYDSINERANDIIRNLRAIIEENNIDQPQFEDLIVRVPKSPRMSPHSFSLLSPTSPEATILPLNEKDSELTQERNILIELEKSLKQKQQMFIDQLVQKDQVIQELQNQIEELKEKNQKPFKIEDEVSQEGMEDQAYLNQVNDKTNQRCRALESQLKIQELQIKELENKLKQSSENHSQNEIQEKENEIRILQEQIEVLKKQQNTSNDDILPHDLVKIEQVSGESEEDQRRRYREAINNLVNERVAELQSKTDEQEKTIHELEKQLDQKNQDRIKEHSIQFEVTKIEPNADETPEEYHKRCLRDLESKANAKIMALYEENEKLREIVEGANGPDVLEENPNETKEERLKKMENIVRILHNEVMKLNDEFTQTKEKLTVEESENKEMKSEIEQLRTKSIINEQDIKEKDETIDNQSNELEELRKKIQQLSEELTAAKESAEYSKQQYALNKPALASTQSKDLLLSSDEYSSAGPSDSKKTSEMKKGMVELKNRLVESERLRFKIKDAYIRVSTELNQIKSVLDKTANNARISRIEAETPNKETTLSLAKSICGLIGMNDSSSTLHFCSETVSRIMQIFGSIVSQERPPKFYINGKEDFNVVIEEAKRVKSQIKSYILRLTNDTKKAHAKMTEIEEKYRKLDDEKNELIDKFSADGTLKLRKSYKILFRRCQVYQENEAAIKESLFSAYPQLRKQVAPDMSIISLVREFILKFPVFIASISAEQVQKPLLTLDHKVSIFQKKLDTVIQKYESLVSRFTLVYRQNANPEILKKVIDSYNNTLRTIFPPTSNLNALSPAREIQRKLNKTMSVIKSIYQLIPNAQMPKKSHLHGYVVGIQRLLMAPLGTQTDVSLDISVSELNGDIPVGGRLFEYEQQINELTTKVENSVPFEHVIDELCGMIGVQPKEYTEDAMNDLFEAIKEKIETTNIFVSQYAEARSFFNAFVTSIGDKVPRSAAVYYNKLKELLK